jgi:hypothetical protein
VRRRINLPLLKIHSNSGGAAAALASCATAANSHVPISSGVSHTLPLVSKTLSISENKARVKKGETQFIIGDMTDRGWI